MRDVVISIDPGIWRQLQSVNGDQPVERSIRFGRRLRHGIGRVLWGRNPKHIRKFSAFVRLVEDSEVDEESFLRNRVEGN